MHFTISSVFALLLASSTFAQIEEIGTGNISELEPDPVPAPPAQDVWPIEDTDLTLRINRGHWLADTPARIFMRATIRKAGLRPEEQEVPGWNELSGQQGLAFSIYATPTPGRIAWKRIRETLQGISAYSNSVGTYRSIVFSVETDPMNVFAYGFFGDGSGAPGNGNITGISSTISGSNILQATVAASVSSSSSPQASTTQSFAVAKRDDQPTTLVTAVSSVSAALPPFQTWKISNTDITLTIKPKSTIDDTKSASAFLTDVSRYAAEQRALSRFPGFEWHDNSRHMELQLLQLGTDSSSLTWKQAGTVFMGIREFCDKKGWSSFAYRAQQCGVGTFALGSFGQFGKTGIEGEEGYAEAAKVNGVMSLDQEGKEVPVSS